MESTTRKQEEILEGNKLIAGFMELALPTLRSEERLQYHTSWDWLMPVVEKINEVLYALPADNNFDWDYLQSMRDWLTSVNIESVHRDVVMIIKWHNQNKNIKL